MNQKHNLIIFIIIISRTWGFWRMLLLVLAYLLELLLSDIEWNCPPFLVFQKHSVILQNQRLKNEMVCLRILVTMLTKSNWIGLMFARSGFGGKDNMGIPLKRDMLMFSFAPSSVSWTRDKIVFWKEKR